VGRSWAAKNEVFGFPKIDWELVGQALVAVRAIEAAPAQSGVLGVGFREVLDLAALDLLDRRAEVTRNVRHEARALGSPADRRDDLCRSLCESV